MKRKLIVIGAGGGAGAIVEMIEALNTVKPRWHLSGFLDDDHTMHETGLFDQPVLGPTDLAGSISGDTMFIIGVANYRRQSDRADIAKRLDLNRERYATLVHPLASVSAHCTIGNGVLVFQNAVVSDGAVVADHVYLSPFAFVGHHAEIGPAAIMAPRSSVNGYAKLGASVYAGAHSVVKDRITVGEGAVLGMGAVVVDDVAADATVVGNPARVMEKRALRV